MCRSKRFWVVLNQRRLPRPHARGAQPFQQLLFTLISLHSVISSVITVVQPITEIKIRFLRKIMNNSNSPSTTISLHASSPSTMPAPVVCISI
ncbi:hypothetical protein L207DRAFT_257901 [Hyaloscypha variabilis F]|uniref:Uncharacterized protein n=1 Tax=Hyaloscypha variabilis (strain UAMH 11265 / GT02V1 / F) TaxID=1149755 RepID=A0A2J6S4B8_HYAVF|nr:hypothetical protein L207DRAFT_257901 [Hyaloscypha variabilis F]